MTRYILICPHSGYIFGDSANFAGQSFDSPEAFAAALNAKIGGADCTEYDYFAYVAPADFPVAYDGQDQDVIDDVHRVGMCVGRVSA